MLREYISRKIRENEELVIDLESDIKNRRNRKKELEKLIKILEDENNDGSEIFSPRNHREQNLNKLKQYHIELEKILKEIEDKQDKLSETKKKRSEYKSMLAETEKIHQEGEKYENVNYQIRDDQSEKGQSEEDKTADEKMGQQVRDQTRKQPEEKKEIREPGQQMNQTESQSENKNQENEVVQTEDKQAESRAEQKGGEQSDAEITQQPGKERIQTKETDEQAEELEYEEPETVPNAMDTKVIIQKSIEEIVKRIEAEKGQDSGSSEQKYKTEFPQKYETKPANEENRFGKIQKENKAGRNNLSEIEIKSAELIVLESERKKEKEFLEKVKKEIDLCFVYAGNRSKCRNELIKAKRLIESYISSIE